MIAEVDSLHALVGDRIRGRIAEFEPPVLPLRKLTVSASAWCETPYEDCFICQTLYRDDHIMRF